MKHILFCILFALICFLSKAQQSINGKVKSKDNDSLLAGATILVKGSNEGTTSDEAGNFSVKVSSLPATLVISHASFITQEILVRGTEPATILLEPKFLA